MSTEPALTFARKPSRGRGALAVVLACLGVVALAAPYVQFGDAVNPRTYTLAAQGSAGDHGWALVAERPRWFGNWCLLVRSEGAAVAAACANEIDPAGGAEPRVVLVPGGRAWVVFGAVPADAQAVELSVQGPDGRPRTLRLATASVDGFEARCYAGTVPARADANADSAAPRARITKVLDGGGGPISWP
jgi:hypothetical protein